MSICYSDLVVLRSLLRDGSLCSFRQQTLAVRRLEFSTVKSAAPPKTQ